MSGVTSFIKENLIYGAILVIFLLMIITSFFAFRNQYVMQETERLSSESDGVIDKTEGLLSNLNLMDLGVRGYALTKNDGLLNPFNNAAGSNKSQLDSIRIYLVRQSLPTENFEKYAGAVTGYIEFCRHMISLATLDNMEEFQRLLQEDRGLGVWQTYQGFAADLITHERTRKAAAESRYAAAVRGNIIIQMILVLVGGPCLFLIFYRIRRQDVHRQALLTNLERNNRAFVFDPGTPLTEDAAEILDASIQNIKNASDLIKKITTGDFEAGWPGLNSGNAALNQQNLSGTLISMRDQMRKIQEEDRERIWMTEGLTKFNEIIRQHQDDPKALADQATRFLVRYMNAQQGAVFRLQEDVEENRFLELSACYAFDKKKFLERRVDIGEGLIGQAFLEGSTVVLRDVPDGYTHITSGLGEATPTCVLIVPMKYNETTEGIFEIAGFEAWEEHQQTFIEKATEYMAATMSSLRSTQKMKLLLEQMQSQTQQLHAQEEEMRQNMEELAATNEEMKRKESEYLKKMDQEIPD